MSRQRVCLVVMPFFGLERPALGPSLLQAALRSRGHVCDIRYFNLDLARRIGVELYERIQGSGGFVGEWVFAPSDPARDASYRRAYLDPQWPASTVSELLRVRASAAAYLDACLHAVPWDEYDIVGFSSVFEQNLAALGLAARVKRAYPRVRIVFGGANWEGPMGRALLHLFPFVDACCSGEADDSFPELVDHLARGEGPVGTPGVVFRDGAVIVDNGPAARIEPLDRVAVPHFDDFFTQFDRADLAGVEPYLSIETARGCWWGARSHCTFCGLNGEAMAFRSKSPDRVLAELGFLRARHGVDRVEVVDNILDMRYFRTVLPALADDPPRMFWEVKASLSLQQVRTLAHAGVVHVQPGIESLADGVLAQMRKGTTTLQNLQTLKWCREFGIEVSWNLVYGFPGEDPADYDEMQRLIPNITFLSPPAGAFPVRLDRFSPYFVDPEAFGITNVRAAAPYRYLYPDAGDRLDDIAYYFDFDYADGRDPFSYAAGVVAAVDAWIAAAGRGDLTMYRDGSGDALLVDTRVGRVQRRIRLRGWKSAVYDLCDRHRALPEVVAHTDVAADEVVAFLEWCVRHGFMVRRGNRYLALAVHTPARRERAPRPALHVLSLAR